jgi:hypothetical protein
VAVTTDDPAERLVAVAVLGYIVGRWSK